MKSSSALTAAKTVIRWLRWAAVLGFVYSAWSGLLYSAVHDIGFYTCPLFLFVAAGAKIAPRNRLTTAIILAAVLVALSFWGHVLALAPPGVTFDELVSAALLGNYRHFTQEALGAVLGVVYIFWSEKAEACAASVPHDSSSARSN
ncbi:MAG TPA: hypothetical protein VNX28_05170 [Gemmataceae bacterium]|jgi:hypothetical protein|nr:hypothetical protein [Gemmataceae bacterium]